ncbi:MAG TPA: 1,2-phenylacetyl-CoA epoxidase subunit PaaC [Actinomycetota bacterium]|nr:1,2-phenylacetyl-CoA epoxidase subunit PaaC [Actinomycetota bacterium]
MPEVESYFAPASEPVPQGPVPAASPLPDDPRLMLLLAMADDELVIGHRHSEWTGWAPHLEEDLAFSSIAQDEMAHARALYELAEPLAGRDPDALALGRPPELYRHAVICERPNRDWGFTLARQWLYDEADDVRTAALSSSAWKELRDLVGVIRAEERYHLEHGRTWFRRAADGGVTARERLAGGLEAAIPEAMALFEAVPGEESLTAEGVLLRSGDVLLGEWLERIGADLESVSLDYVLTKHVRLGEFVPTSSGEVEEREELTVPGVERREGRWVHVGAFAGTGGRHGRHSEDFRKLWEEMTALHRAFPGATW